MKESFYIEGMTCTACSSGIERSLGRKSFVKKIEVSLLNKSANIEFDENQTNLDEIFKLIEKLGYSPKKTLAKEKKGFFSPNVKLALAVVFTLFVVYLSMGAMLSPSLLPESLLAIDNHSNFLNVCLQLIGALIVMHLGRDFYIQGFKALWHRQPNMSSLIAIGTSAALISSLWPLYLVYTNQWSYGHYYFESVCVILMFVMVGKRIENVSKDKALDAMQALMKNAPKTALKMQNNQQIEVLVDSIVVGDILKVLPGSAIAVDGEIIEGEGELDESMLSGEALPVYKKVGDKVFSGTFNSHTSFLMKATQNNKNSTLSQIIEMIYNAQSSKAEISRLADKVSSVFVPSVIAISILAFVVWLIIAPKPDFWWNFKIALEVFVSVLVISCPCALGLATPMSILVANQKASSLGLFFKDAKSLEKARLINTIVFDKTGTLTNGKPVVKSVHSKIELLELLSLALSIERSSEHVIAKGIVEYAKENNAPLKEMSEVKVKTGFGISAKTDYQGAKEIIKVGNSEFFNPINTLEIKENGILVFVGRVISEKEDELLGVFVLEDLPKKGVKEHIAQIKNLGINTLLLSGDNRENVKKCALELGIDGYISNAKPQDKLNKIKELKEKGQIVMMVGDGLNDAPSLAMSDVAVVMAKGSDVSVQAADIVSFNNDIKSVYSAIQLSQATIKNIKENLFWAFCYNSVFIPLACGVLYKANIMLSPAIAGLAMSLSSVSVVLNSQRLRNFKIKDH
ncbi:copper-translocating P-type ATPase CopA [Helicobacter pylori]|uniref:copper-translocating P-type ATPase CopA n=1 Tax=Helicobacter pylori TaxID=210 RepID=UPI00165AD899|nr:copper-translocating P-type ATPase CopA [Helicobacter pylori]WQS21262.1 copper-translocating P-type ATPase CopA [Helicobacter pylori]WQS30601.1 copper-translocating P-type ATPase CopA [Helicobacter pylori]